jgi:hypothetical protein
VSGQYPCGLKLVVTFVQPEETCDILGASLHLLKTHDVL